MNLLRLAVIGCGRIGQTHIMTILKHRELFQLEAIIDSNKELLDKIALDYGVKKCYSDVDEALKDPDIDAVIVSVPHHLHCSIAEKAAQAKKHILVEKPLAVTLAEADIMINSAKSNRVKLMVGQSRRFSEAVQRAKQMFVDLGKPYNMTYSFMARFNAGRAPSWWGEMGVKDGLIIPMMGSHTIDTTLWFFEDREPVSVYAKASSQNNDFTGDDEATILITFNDGTFTTNCLSMNTYPEVHQCIINCPKGSLFFTHQYKSGMPVGVSETELSYAGKTIIKGGFDKWNYSYQLEEFYSSIKENREPSSDAVFARKVMLVMEAARRSAIYNQVIHL